jgi:fructokinase
MNETLLAGVELGGTKCICLLARGPHDIRAQLAIPTAENSDATMRRIEGTLHEWQGIHGPIAALGIASFGPVDLSATSPTYGFIMSTPKSGWSHTDVARRLRCSLNVPVAFNTDVYGAALAEGRWGAAQRLRDFAYVTVGTGIGVGLVVADRSAGGFTHPELGHIRVARSHGDDWPGSCRFHGDCLEGLASGPSIERRLGLRAEQLAPDHPVWNLVVHALAQLLHTLVLATAPQRILLGGGVMNSQGHLFPRLRCELQRSLNHYVEAPQLTSEIETYIGPPALGGQAGPLGSLALALGALGTQR